MYKTKWIVPTLKIDKEALKKYNRNVSVTGKFERRIVYNLLSYLSENGFNVTSIYDGEEETEVKTIKEAMELIFNLDEVRVYFDTWSLVLVLGNAEDIISDWSYFHSDQDKFNKAMEAFNAEDYA